MSAPRRAHLGTTGLLGLGLGLGLGLCLAACPKDAPAPDSGTSKVRTPPPPPRVVPKADPGGSLLGGERGLDHVGVVVKDLAAAREHFTSKLGFGNPEPGRLPNGIENVNFYFGDSTYLELLTHYDATKAKGIAAFQARHGDGAMFFVLAVFSYNLTAAFLRHRGHPVGGAFPGRIKSKGFSGQRTMWHTFFFQKPPPGDPFFFIAYRRRLRTFLLRKLEDPALRAKHFSHPNTALGTRAVYILARDLGAANKTYTSFGLPATRSVTATRFGARGSDLRAGRGNLVLLAAQDPKGLASAFLRRRGDGAIFAVAIDVADLEQARALVAKSLGVAPVVGDGLFGKSFFVPPEQARGVWLEFVQAKKI